MGTLSVRENLHFSAALRLPSQMTHAERKERVERVIDELGLRGCASTKVINFAVFHFSKGDEIVLYWLSKWVQGVALLA